MVSGTPLEKASPIDAFSEIWQDRKPFLSKDQKVVVNGRGKNTNLYEPLSGFVDQNGKLWTDLHPESIACRFPGGVKGTRDETSLFSSSLSDLLKHKMRFSASNVPFHQSAANAGSQNGHLGPLNCVEETESQAIKNLLPDEEELLSGVTSLGQVTHAGNQDDFEDFDLFSSIGGIELEADERIWVGNRSGNFNKSMPNTQWGSTSAVGNHNEFLLQKTTRLLNGVGVEKGSTHNSSGVENTFHPSAFQASAGNQFSLCQPSHSPNFVNLESCYANSFNSHSLPDAHSHVANVIPWKSLDNMTDSVGECPRVAGEISRDLYQADLAGKAASLNGRAYGYSANGSLPYQMDRYLSGKSDLYECHPSRSSVWPNSPSFLNGEHANYAVQLPGYPKLPHSMMNVASPMHHLQVGSAPGVNAAFWDPVDSFEDLSVQPNSIQSVAMHFGSPANSVDMSSHRTFSHAGGTCMGTSNHAEILSQMSHSLNGRNPSISMPSSFGFPNERVRNRANSGNADKKNYELNIDRILRGDDARTTLMIKNIPNKYTSKMLLATIDEQHKGRYDFIYLPIDFKNKCNVGYAFINMVDPKHIVSFYQTFNGKRWEKFNSEKIATLAYARIQGKSALIAHFQNSSLMNEDKRCRPILFHTDGPNAGDQEPFPSSNSFRLRSGRAHTNFNGDMEGRGQGRCNGTKA